MNIASFFDSGSVRIGRPETRGLYFFLPEKQAAIGEERELVVF